MICHTLSAERLELQMLRWQNQVAPFTPRGVVANGNLQIE